MMTKIGGGSAGSCGGLVQYLEKEQAGLWFGQNREQLAGHEVVAEIDPNKRNLGREDAKYYQVILAPSQAELAHIGADSQKLQAFTRAAMEEYAQNFGKGIESKDLVWFAKIEHSRSFDHTDRAVQLGEQQKGVAKTGDQTHIHVIVSRTENLREYVEGKKNGLHERKNPYHLSPMTNHKATTKGAVIGGFERNSFSQRAEQTFDQAFRYERSLTESFRFLHCMKYGDEQAKGEMQRQAAEQAQKRAQSHEQSQRLEMYQQRGKTPENEFSDDLRAGLSKAYQQKDVNDLGAALASAQAKRERQRVAQERQAEEARKQALEATKLAEQEKKLAQQQKIEQKPENSPRISRGLGL
ncbi:DUF5712 family protein [Spirosoma sordidisoli]|uniref:Mobilization protein n=1 Tax=Spirosoma sordidisoli TaxID=2502893 RepID=A0A4Q2UBD3_9BACT|nr:DUF5712 family protein [Spirosoma sordidisoli]RYC66217.1 hypothetical protein EQG79_30810 [Spirosoma sordidisoli]